MNLHCSKFAREDIFQGWQGQVFWHFEWIRHMRRDIQRIADEEQRTITQICEMLLNEGIEAYKKEGPKFIQRLIAKQKSKIKDA